MSYFKKDIVYIIVATADVTNEMYNNMKKYFNSDVTNQRGNSNNTKIVFKVKFPISAVFNGYIWHNIDDIRREMAKEEWN